MPPSLSVVIPTLNEAVWLGPCISALRASAASAQARLEVIVVDAKSSDDTGALGARLGAQVIASEVANTAHQLNLGAMAATAPVFWFLHADTLVPPGAVGAILASGAQAGWFHVELLPTGPHLPAVTWGLGLIARGINLRTDVCGGATGDQGLFLTRDAWERCGPFARQPVLETWEMTRAVVRAGLTVHRLPHTLRISARRWERGGLCRTTLRMYAIRAAYLGGASHQVLERWWRRT